MKDCLSIKIALEEKAFESCKGYCLALPILNPHQCNKSTRHFYVTGYAFV